ncbi:hypothetical protein STEG23_033124 [Scotinomys teguina]
MPKGKKAERKKVAPSPALLKKQPKKVVISLVDKRPKKFIIGAQRTVEITQKRTAEDSVTDRMKKEDKDTRGKRENRSKRFLKPNTNECCGIAPFNHEKLLHRNNEPKSDFSLLAVDVKYSVTDMRSLA